MNKVNGGESLYRDKVVYDVSREGKDYVLWVRSTGKKEYEGSTIGYVFTPEQWRDLTK